LKTRLKSSRIKKRKNKLIMQSEEIEIFETSYIKYEKNKVSIDIQKRLYIKSKSTIVVSKNFNLVCFENDYFDDIQKYLINKREDREQYCHC